MDRVIGDTDGPRVRKKIKFRQPKARFGVKLQRPGLNLPTIGTLVILLIHAAIELTGGAEIQRGEVKEIRDLYFQFAVSWNLMTEGRIWGLVTHSLLHANWLHVTLNALLFYYSSSRLGHILSTSKILILFTAASVGAAFCQVLSQALFSGLSQVPLVGASGGNTGLLLAQTILYPDSRMLLLKISGRNMGKGVLLASFLLFLMTPGLGLPVFSDLGTMMVRSFGEMLFAIGHLYHFVGGLIGVLLVGRLLPRLKTLEDLKAERAKQESLASSIEVAEAE